MNRYFVRQIASHPYCDAQGYHEDFVAFDDEESTVWAGYVANPAEHSDWRQNRRVQPVTIRQGWVEAVTPTGACQEFERQVMQSLEVQA